MDILSYEDAEQYCKQPGRWHRDALTIANNTKLVRYFDTYAVRYHETDVVTYHPAVPMNGRPESITLAAGGWYTDTTLRRIEEFAPFGIDRRDNGRWWVMYDNGTFDPAVTPFTEGLTLFRNLPGGGGGWSPDLDTTLKIPVMRAQDIHNERINHMIRKYVKAVTGHTSWQIPHDCVLCVFDQKTGMVTGDVFGDYQHLIEHMLAGEWVPQMADAASYEAGGGGYGGKVYPQYIRRFLQQRLLLGAVGSKTGRRPQGEMAWHVRLRRERTERMNRRF